MSADAIRSRLEEMTFPHPMPPGCVELIQAVMAVLDLCDGEAPALVAPLFVADIRGAIADALGVPR